MSEMITIIKRRANGEEVWRYEGTILKKEGNTIVVEARFRSAELPFMGTVFRKEDRFVETYYTDRWYNTFEIHDREDDRLKGWYCNITRPAIMERADVLAYEDLALDLWVSPKGEQTILDEDEFEALQLDDETRSHAQMALKELQAIFNKKEQPGFE